jgi:hypothetical protein
MTDSCCWIDISDDAVLCETLAAKSLPTRLRPEGTIDLGYRYLWISDLDAWANKNGQTIEYPSDGLIVHQISLDKAGLLRFLDDMLREAPNSAPLMAARRFVAEEARDGVCYRVLADEY